MAQLSTQLANIVGGPVSFGGEGCGLERIGMALNPQENLVDINDPASLKREAQRLYAAGDQAGALQMLQAAQRLEQGVRADRADMRAGRAEGRAERAETRAEVAARAAERVRQDTATEKQGALAQEQQDRVALLNAAKDLGHFDLIKTSTGLSNAELSKELNRRQKERRDERKAGTETNDAAWAEENMRQSQAAAIRAMADNAPTKKAKQAIEAQAKAVEAGASVNGALSTATKFAYPDSPGPVWPTATQTVQITDALKQVDSDKFGDLAPGDQFRFATAVMNRQKQTGESLEEAVNNIATGAKVDDDDWFFGFGSDTVEQVEPITVSFNDL